MYTICIAISNALLFIILCPGMQQIYEFVNASMPGDLLLKTLMCRLHNPNGLVPFWKTPPFAACKMDFSCLF
jgi:hypothetical protein